MPRATNNPASRQRRKRILKLASGFRGSRHRLNKMASQAIMRAGLNSFRDRKKRKRDFRQLWIARINAGARANGMSYSRFMNGLLKAGITLDRKVLADISVHDAAGFIALTEKAKGALAA